MSKFFKHKFFSYAAWYESGCIGFWFRLCGFGLDINNYPLTFSERNGYSKFLKIGRLKVKVLNARTD